MNRILLATAVILTQGLALASEPTTHSATAGPFVPTIGPTPPWAMRLLVLIAIMFAAAIAAGLIWRPPAEEPPISTDDHHHAGAAGHH